MYSNDITLQSFYNKIVLDTKHKTIMHLSIYLDSSDTILKNKYIAAAEKHNKQIIDDPHFYDAGFDLFLPKNESNDDIDDLGTNFYGTGWTDVKPTTAINFQVKCCAKLYNLVDEEFRYTPFYTYARSSISKTPLRLANNQGIIDAGYRGSLIGMFDCIETKYYMESYTRLLQICAPGLIPIFVHIVESVEELGPNTLRGEGGLGSTGK